MSSTAAASRPIVFRIVLVLTLLFLLIPGVGGAQAPQSASVVRISQFYTAGGNSTSPYGCDFVELFNSSPEPTTLNGWSVQTYNGSWRIIKLGVITIPPSSYYLVAKTPCSGNTPLPTPDVDQEISLGITGGQIALARNEIRVDGKDDPDVADFVGFGNATAYEGSGPAPKGSFTTSAYRKGGGCQDQDDNQADFELLTPVARNSSSARNVCADAAPTISAINPADGSANIAPDANFTVTFSEPVTLIDEWFRVECDLAADITPAAATVTGGPTAFTIDPNQGLYGDDACRLTIFADKVQDQDAADPPDALASDFTARFTTAPGACAAPAYRIHDLQGSAASSPVSGETRTVEAVVVGDFQGADQLSGFFVQEEASDQDGDAITSEGIFVSDGSAALLDVAAGQRVRLTGRVAEIDGATALTDLTRAVDCGAADPPGPVTVTLPAPDPAWWEQVEGMRVVFEQALTVAGSDELSAAGRLTLMSGERPLAYTQQYAPDAAGYATYRADLAARLVVLDDGSDRLYPDPIRYPPPGLSASNTVRVGDRVAAGLTAVVDGRGTRYRLHPTTSPAFAAENPRPAAPAIGQANLRAVFLSLDDYFTPDDGIYGPRGAGSEAELQRQRDKLVAAWVATDASIIAVSGRENDGTGAGSALSDLVAGLNAATSPATYVAVATGDTWGGTEATVGLIYRADRVTPVGAPAILVTGAFAQTEPAHAAPMAQTFEQATSDERLTVVVNQWHDRAACPTDGPDADQGDGQGCWNASRAAAASDLATWLATDPTQSGDPDILVLGELNAFRLETPIQTLVGRGYTDLLAQFAGDEAVTALWDGAGGYADHALASASLAAQTVGAGPWAINADEPAALDYQTENKSAGQVGSLYAPDAYRSSDRDPVVVDLRLPDQPDPLPAAPAVSIAKNGAAVTLSWQHLDPDAQYEIWRGTSPYFAPPDEGTQVATLPAAPGNLTYEDADTVGDPAENHFWLARGRLNGSVSGPSNRVGEFDFSLLTGD